MQNKRAQIEIGEYIVNWANKYRNGVTNAKLSVIMYFLYAGYPVTGDDGPWDGQNCFNASFLTYPEGPGEYYTRAKYVHFGGMKLRNRNSTGHIYNPMKHRYVTEFLTDNFDLLTKNYRPIRSYLIREDGPWFLTKLDPDALDLSSLYPLRDLRYIPGDLIRREEAHLFTDEKLDHTVFRECIDKGGPVQNRVPCCEAADLILGI